MTEPVSMNTCPTEETLAAFVDGRLNDDARKRVIEHMADCGSCRDLVLAATEFQAAERGESADGATISRFSPRTWFTAAAALVAAAVLIVVLGPMLMERGSTPPEIRKLAELSDSLSTRPVEGRFTGGFARRDVFDVPRAGNEEKDIGQDSVEYLANELSTKAALKPTAENLHALGIAQFYRHDHADGLATLIRAIQADTDEDDLLAAIKKSRNARLLTDLSAALQSPVSDDKAQALNRTLSYEAAAAAWKLDKTEETAWNRAVAIEGTAQVGPALRAWQDYLALDSTSAWAEEAKQKIETLKAERTTSELWNEATPRFERALDAGDSVTVAALVKTYPQQTRMYGEDRLMACWATNHKAGRPDLARRCLSAAKLIGNALVAHSGESLLHDAVATIERAADSSQLADAHAAYALGRDAYPGHPDTALSEFTKARALFAKTHSPYVLLSEIYAAASLYYRNDYQRTRQETGAILTRFPAPERYRAALATALWNRANATAFLGRFEDAISDYNATLQIFASAGEQDNVLAMREILASVYELVGDRALAWNARYSAFADLRAFGRGSRRTAQTIGGGARAARAHGFTALARLLTDEEIAAAQLPELKTAAYARGAVLDELDGDANGAQSLADLAVNTAQKIPDPSIRDFAKSDPDFVRAMCARADPDARIAIIENAVAATVEQHDELRSVELLLLLSAEHLARGEVQDATTTLDRAIATIDRQEAALTNFLWCDALLDERRAVYRNLVTLLAEKGRTDDALVQAERCRARTVRAGFSRVTDVRSLSDLDSLRRAIPPRTAVVFYAASSDRLFTWLLSSKDARFFDTRIPARGTRTLRRLETKLSSNEFDAAVAEASQWLVEPWRASLAADVRTIVFIPDEQTANFPFNALLDGTSLLLERFNILTAPSLALHIACIEQDRKLRLDHGSTLVVAASDARSDLGLNVLSAAGREVRMLRERPLTSILESGSATKRAFLAAAPAARQMHFITHGLINPMRPSLSALVLQRDADDDGLLYVHEIARLRLPQTRMVVIAACGASRAGRTGREGTATIGRAFMAAGVPVVISSTRDIGDAMTAEIVTSFYRRVDAGADPVTALRLTQLSMKGRIAPVDWAALQVMGGIAETEREKWLAN